MDGLNYIYELIKNEIHNILIESDKEELFSCFDDSHLSQFDDHNATITLNLKYSKLLLDTEENRKLVDKAIKKLYPNKNVKCHFITPDDYLKITNETIEKDLNDNLMADFTFDNFVVGNSNREAFTAALACSTKPGERSYNPLFIYGNSGLGKTHLLNAIGNHLKRNDPDARILYISSTKFVNEVAKSIKDKTIEEYKSQLNSVDILLVDDIQQLSGKKGMGDIFFSIYEELFNNRKQIVLTSDRPPYEIKDIEDRLKTRFSQGLSVTISSLEYETAYKILKLKLQALPDYAICDIDDDVISFIATYFASDVRQLEGAITRLLFMAINFTATSKESIIKIDLPLALDIFKYNEIGSIGDTDALNINNILKVVADYYNLTEKQLKSKSRTKNISNARHIAMYLSREMLDLSYDKIGEEFGGKDHTTVMNAHDKIEKLVAENDMYKQIISELKKKLAT